MVGGLDQPLQHCIGVDLEHPSHGTDAQPFRQCPHGPNKHVGRYPLPMQRRAMRLKKIPATFAAIELSPLAATGMTVGRDIAQPEPATIATVGSGTEMMRGVDLPAAASCRRNRRGWRRRWLQPWSLDRLLTSSATGLTGETW